MCGIAGFYHRAGDYEKDGGINMADEEHVVQKRNGKNKG